MSEPQKHRDYPLELPAEIWQQIVRYGQYDSQTRRDMISLASTNKFIRGIAFPAILHELDLDASEDMHSKDHYSKKFIRCVQALKSFPVILNAVRRLHLISLRICPDDDEDSEEEDRDSPDSITGAREDSQLHRLAYRETITLLPSFPHLYHLGCWGCVFVPEFFFHIFRIPNLQTLYINEPYIFTNNPIKPQLTAPSSLHNFQYYPDIPYERCPPEVTKLIISLINQFTIFSIPLDFLPRILADNSLPIALPKLKKLSMHGHLGSPNDYSDLMRIHSFLDLTPNLCELRIVGDIHTKLPFILSETTIPHIKTLMSPPCIANGIASTRRLEKLHIIVFGESDFRESYTVVSQGIQHVLYSGPLKNPEKELLHLAQVFPSASIVEITAMDDCPCTPKELSDTVLSILPKFRQLKKCFVSGESGYPFDDGCPPACCPVGRVDDPKYRSHPTLEELHMLSFYCWTWCSKVGWHPVRSLYVHDVPYTMDLKFFFNYHPQ